MLGYPNLQPVLNYSCTRIYRTYIKRIIVHIEQLLNPLEIIYLSNY